MSNEQRTYQLFEVERLSGRACTFYSLRDTENGEDLLTTFLQSYSQEFSSEVQNIVTRLQVMAKKFGSEYHFFKHDEGVPGDLVCALYDDEESKLRLYCIRFGSCAVIFGGGGYKPKSISAYQDDPILNRQAEIVKQVSALFAKKLKDGELWWHKDGMTIDGIDDQSFLFNVEIDI